jgi:hypothetical protein
MKNKVNFLWKGFRLFALIAFVSLIAFSIVSCDDKGSDIGKGKVIIENASPTDGEIITTVLWRNNTTGASQDEKSLRIPRNSSATLSLDAGDIDLWVSTNNDGDGHINFQLLAGTTVTIIWTRQLNQR